MTEQEEVVETVPAAEEPLPAPVEAPVEEHPDDKIARAEAAADRIEKANKESAQILEEQRRIAVSNTLGGKSDVLQKETEEDKIRKGAQALISNDTVCPGVQNDTNKEKV